VAGAIGLVILLSLILCVAFAMSGEKDEIADDEYLYRRVPCKPPFFTPGVKAPPSPEVFRPRDRDKNGLSLDRAKDVTLQEAATPPDGSQRKYLVARVRAEDLRKEGMIVELDPDKPGHVLVPNLDYAHRRGKREGEWQVKMATELCEVFDPESESRVWP